MRILLLPSIRVLSGSGSVRSVSAKGGCGFLFENFQKIYDSCLRENYGEVFVNDFIYLPWKIQNMKDFTLILKKF